MDAEDFGDTKYNQLENHIDRTFDLVDAAVREAFDNGQNFVFGLLEELELKPNCFCCKHVEYQEIIHSPGLTELKMTGCKKAFVISAIQSALERDFTTVDDVIQNYPCPQYILSTQCNSFELSIDNMKKVCELATSG